MIVILLAQIYLIRNFADVIDRSIEHLILVIISTLTAIFLGIPLAILLIKYPRLSKLILSVANIVQTIPSLALFGFLIPIPYLGGIGMRTAIISLVLYALLPIIHNTITGIKSIDPALSEAAEAMGMTYWQKLFRLELPLAARSIIAGIRISAVTGVGVATIAAAIGAGGLGVYIFRGVSMVDHQVILAGAIPAALLALLVDLLLAIVEKKVTHP
ncbi:MAG: ABC transporter permease [Blastocatellia bacterium]|nr:ABC transporter permease [Blastocatellia bacterium]MBL8192333.1 ABC transporter permease [Blastocatellia bacterium]MBN8721607.1 ABC transporter permease [Acidobacteriota bacterium]